VAISHKGESMGAISKFEDDKSKISRIKKQLLRLDIRYQEGISWQDIISQKDSRLGFNEWKKERMQLDAERKEIEDLLLVYVNAFRQKKLKEISAIKFKHYCSICLIIRDENEYLEEWLDWHLGQGVEHFYIYDHGSKMPVVNFVKSLSESVQDKVTVIGWSGKHKSAQHEAYNDCLKNYAKQSRWIGFIDADEMVRVKKGGNLQTFLKDYEAYAGVMVLWVLYGADGQVKKTKAPLRERFLNASVQNIKQSLGKVFVQPMLIRQMVIHNGYPIECFDVVDEYKNQVDEAAVVPSNKTTDLICVDHYFTKSYEEWIEKMKRGSADAYYNRRYKEFFFYNPDMKDCMENNNLTQEYAISTKC